MGHTYVYTYEKYGQTLAKSGWPQVRKLREVREMSRKKNMLHTRTNVIRIHVRRKNIHAMYMPHVSYRNT